MGTSLNTLVIGCGGCGSNVVGYLKNGMDNENFIEYMTLDSSDANKQEGIEFNHLKQNNSDGSLLTGTGGIRGEHLEDLKPGVLKFVNDKLLHKHNGVIYLVFSTSGGSGSVIAPILLQHLLTHDIPVCCLLVHDTSTEQYSINGKKCLESIFKTTKSADHNLAVTYFLNTNEISVVNASILKEFQTIMNFHDTDNITEIDNNDMKNFYNNKKYRHQCNIPSGIYSIGVLKPEHVIDTVSKHKVLLGRSLTNNGIDPLKPAGLKTIKHGKAENGVEAVLILINNFNKQYDILKKALDAFNEDIEEFGIDIDPDATIDGDIVC